MYPYHNKIKQRIRAGELESYYFTDNYKNIGEALALVFNTFPFFIRIRHTVIRRNTKQRA